VVAVVKEDGTIIVANLGDSRAIMSQQGQSKGGQRVVHQLSTDHKPDRAQERDRVERAGGNVSQEVHGGVPVGPFRVWTAEGKGGLSLSRSIGDRRLKDPECTDGLIKKGELALVSWEPDVTTDQMHVRAGGSEWLVLASDGVWDVVTNHEAISIAADVLMNTNIHDAAENAGVAQAVSDAIVRAAFQGGSDDNITALVVRIQTVAEEGDGVSVTSAIDEEMQALRAKQSRIEHRLAAAKARARQATMTRAEFMDWAKQEEKE
jgi:serine/threonine protein phosphatase PrpC